MINPCTRVGRARDYGIVCLFVCIRHFMPRLWYYDRRHIIIIMTLYHILCNLHIIATRICHDNVRLLVHGHNFPKKWNNAAKATTLYLFNRNIDYNNIIMSRIQEIHKNIIYRRCK